MDTDMRFAKLLVAPVVAGLVVLAACSQEQGSPMEPQAPVPSFSSSGSGGSQLVECQPLPAATKSATIGFGGGVIQIGPHRLIVPPGALLMPKTITAKIVAGDVRNSVQFSPEGLQFTAGALLVMSYDNCKHKGMFDHMKVVYTSNDLRNILELLPSIDIPINHTVIGTVSHFSRYAIAF
jgi:hypothetical protein